MKHISIHDNFFELGGHSLSATQIASRIRDWLNMEIPLRVVFERLTIAGQAEYIENKLKGIHVIESASRSSVNNREEFTF